MNIYPALFLILLTILTSCGPYEYWDISHFNIDNNALENNSKVKILYFSRGITPYKNHDENAYRHYVVVSKTTNDTVNVLTTSSSIFLEENLYKTHTFYTIDSKENIEFEELLREVQMITEKNKNDDFFNEPKKLRNVYRDPNFDYIADNNYPTIFGEIMLVEQIK